jgi:hypothetical protein
LRADAKRNVEVAQAVLELAVLEVDILKKVK